MYIGKDESFIADFPTSFSFPGWEWRSRTRCGNPSAHPVAQEHFTGISAEFLPRNTRRRDSQSR